MPINGLETFWWCFLLFYLIESNFHCKTHESSRNHQNIRFLFLTFSIESAVPMESKKNNPFSTRQTWPVWGQLNIGTLQILIESFYLFISFFNNVHRNTSEPKDSPHKRIFIGTKYSKMFQTVRTMDANVLFSCV